MIYICIYICLSIFLYVLIDTRICIGICKLDVFERSSASGCGVAARL